MSAVLTWHSPSFDPAHTRADALRRTRAAFAGAGLDDAALEARLLVGLAAGTDAAGLLAHPETPLGPAAAERLTAFARRRLAREPVGRIAGAREFWGLPFRLSAATLEPRPDTETVVAAALAALPGREVPLRILDLGTGAGCILVALLSERPAAIGIGIDRSEEALRTARRNAVLNRVGGRAAFAASNWADALAGRFDLVVSNPPYIDSAAVAGLAPEVSRHDPLAALDGGPDGLDAYREILPRLAALLTEAGIAVLEIGREQAAGVAALARGTSVVVRAVHGDLAGRDRAVVLARGRRCAGLSRRLPPSSPRDP